MTESLLYYLQIVLCPGKIWGRSVHSKFGQDIGNIWNFMKLLTDAFLVVLTTDMDFVWGCWAIEEWFLSIIISLRASKCNNGHKRSL